MRAISLLMTLCLSYSAFAAEPPARTIAIQPLDTVKPERLAIVKKGLEDAFGCKVEILETQPLPKDAWYAPRSRYRADQLLKYLNQRTPEAFQIVIGITAKDISTTKEEHVDWGVFGLGEVGGRSCIVSTFRLGARGADEERLRERLRKVAVHEVGHVAGLDHCPNPGCVMQDAESSILTVDGETGKFCQSCTVTLTK